MTAYGQVRDVLNTAVRFHRRLEEFYGQLAKQEDRERVRMLLDYMSRHEQGFERMLADYGKGKARSLLDTWMQFEPDDRALKVPEPRTLRPDMSVDEVMEVALGLDDELVRFYSQAIDLTQDSEIRDLFEGLAQQAEDEKSRIKLNATMIKDM
jgi:rubrerythrin